MRESTMKARRWTWARVVKAYLELCLVLGAVVWMLLLAYLLLRPWSQEVGAQAEVVVAMGSHSLLPRMPLELATGSPTPESPFLRATLVQGYGELRAMTTDRNLQLLTMLVLILGIPILLYLFWLLREFLRTVLEGSPFAPANSRRLRRIGFILLGLTLLAPGVEYWVGQEILSRLQVETLPLSPALRFPEETFFLGLLFLVFSAVFRYGTELEEERSLTV
jgi:hypothetical protein